jgi:hypothetical protein
MVQRASWRVDRRALPIILGPAAAYCHRHCVLYRRAHVPLWKARRSGLTFGPPQPSSARLPSSCSHLGPRVLQISFPPPVQRQHQSAERISGEVEGWRTAAATGGPSRRASTPRLPPSPPSSSPLWYRATSLPLPPSLPLALPVRSEIPFWSRLRSFGLVNELGWWIFRGHRLVS